MTSHKKLPYTISEYSNGLFEYGRIRGFLEAGREPYVHLCSKRRVVAEGKLTFPQVQRIESARKTIFLCHQNDGARATRLVGFLFVLFVSPWPRLTFIYMDKVQMVL